MAIPLRLVDNYGVSGLFWPSIQKLEVNETELLMRLRGPIPAGNFQYQEISEYEDRSPQTLRRGRGGGGRRPSERPRNNGRAQFNDI